MFERYTEKARRTIFFARYEASQFGAPQIEMEYLLLGLLREDKNLVARFFSRLGASLDSIRQEIESRTQQRERISTSLDLALTKEAKQALAFATEEADRLGHRHINTEHLLLGLLRVEDSLTAQILSKIGLRLSDVREEIAQQVERQVERQVEKHVTGRLDLWQEETQPLDRDERWFWDISEACTDLGFLKQDELIDEFQLVASLRQFRADAEALLRLLAAKGLIDAREIVSLAFELRDAEKLKVFIERLRRGKESEEGRGA